MPEWGEVLLRVAVAVLAGGAIGMNRELQHKSVGVRTLGLVSLSGCLVVMAVTQSAGAVHGPDALSRVMQGLLTGIGFLGAGVIIRSADGLEVRGLTTSACILLVAVLGMTCGLANWRVLAAGGAGALFLLLWGGPIEMALDRAIRRKAAPPNGDAGSERHP